MEIRSLGNVVKEGAPLRGSTDSRGDRAMTTRRNENRHEDCRNWAYCVCDERRAHADFVSYAAETADWDATPEDAAYALRVTAGPHNEERLDRALDHCFGLDLMDQPFGLEE
jgi:hypothetical protein